MTFPGPSSTPAAGVVARGASSLLARVSVLSKRQKLYGLLAVVVVLAAAAKLAGGAAEERHAALGYAHEEELHDGAESTAADSQSGRRAVPLQGMSEVEIPVRASGFLFDDAGGMPGEVVSFGGRRATFDLYFLRPSESGANRAERLYRKIMVARSPGHDGSVVLSVADEDVPVLLNLAQLGEYQLVRTSPAGSDAGAREPSLRSRPWIRKIMGDDSVVVVP